MNLLIAYTLIALCLAYFLKHQLDIVSLLSTKNDLKLRSQILEKKSQLKLYLKLCPFWPVLILKELYDEIKKLRQG